MDNATLSSYGAYNGTVLYLGVGFRVNDGITTDTITLNGKTQTFWYADNIHPLMANNLILKEIALPEETSEDSSSEESEISEQSSTAETSSQVSQESFVEQS